MKFTGIALSTALAAVVPATAEIYFQEKFNDEAWKSRWTIPTKWRDIDEMGKWKHTPGAWYWDKADKGIQTSEDAKYYGLSAPLTKPYVSGDKELVIQYTVRHEQKVDCGGAYIKLLSSDKKFSPDSFGGDTPYAVMFGPDICGSKNKKTHVILHYEPKDENLMINNEIKCETNDLSHLYTLVIRPDNTFEVLIDNKSVRKESLETEFDFLEPKQIKDPDASKPADWDDRKKIPDPTDVKPEGWDDIPKEIPDPDAEKPDDWDEEDDGEWEPPMIENPEYKGKWKPKQIENPDYKGKWIHPMIDNPEYKTDNELYKVCKNGCSHVGFELWQVKTGTLFDDIIVTDSLEEAQAFAEATFFKKKDAEKKMRDKVKDEEKGKEKADRGEDDDEMDYDGEEDEF